MTPDIITTILTGVGVVFGSLFVIRRLLEGFERDISNQLSGLLSDLSGLRLDLSNPIKGFRRDISDQLSDLLSDISAQLSAINTKIDNVIRDRLEGERGPGREPDAAL